MELGHRVLLPVLSRETLGPPRFLHDSIDPLPWSPIPVGRRDARLLTRLVVLSAALRKAPTPTTRSFGIQFLHLAVTARGLPVYASPRRSPGRCARLGSRGLARLFLGLLFHQTGLMRLVLAHTEAVLPAHLLWLEAELSSERARAEQLTKERDQATKERDQLRAAYEQLRQELVAWRGSPLALDIRSGPEWMATQ